MMVKGIGLTREEFREVDMDENMIPIVLGNMLRNMANPRCNNSHSWDVCKYANDGCCDAEIGSTFSDVCSADYNSCKIKYVLDFGDGR